jgi:1-aminocyclopropane-1-carboxylate deaminase/D-cysteine desulfhydrase-like pyridoxal-dependent ACC family enzyme
MALTGVRRVPLGLFPTPLQHVTDLGEVPGLHDLLVKRDDLTGYAWGGNKVRTVEYVLADALAQGADTVVVAGGPTSNFAALLAVAAAGRGLAVRQVCYGRPRHGASALALSRRAGARVEFTGSDERQSMEHGTQLLAECLRAEGGRPYVVPRGGATPVGACGFADAAAELVAQLTERGVQRVTVVLPAGSGGSISGLLAGLAAHDHEDRVAAVVGVAVTRAPSELEEHVDACSVACSGLLGGPVPSHHWRLVDGREPEHEVSLEALRHGGLVADPVYNARALAWLARHRDELAGPLVYWSTGGALASADELTEEAG